MTTKELKQIYYLTKEINMLEDKLTNLELAVHNSNAKISGMPLGSGVSDKIGNCVAEIVDLKNLINLNIEKRVFELSRLNRYVQTIDDSYIRQIITYRYNDLLTWRQIAQKIGGGNTEDSVRMAHNRFLQHKK